jgi:ribosomal protein S13
MRFSTNIPYNTHHHPSCVATFQTFYGIGKVRASRINCFLLNHPVQRKFNKDFSVLISQEILRNVFSTLLLDTALRLHYSHFLRDKILIFCYQATRLFQELPTRGQRTRSNAGTPSKRNPYLSLNVNYNFYPALAIAYKRRELMHNGRFDELKAYNNALLEKEKMKKTDKKLKSKSSRENFMRTKQNENSRP